MGIGNNPKKCKIAICDRGKGEKHKRETGKTSISGRKKGDKHLRTVPEGLRTAAN